MSSWIDHTVIALLVIVSAAYAIYSLGPKSLRTKIRKHVFGRETAAGTETGCSSCGDCGPSMRKSEAKISLASVRKELRSPKC